MPRMRKILRLTAFYGVPFLILTAGGCSQSASAPPVSLPAPVTGRITVTSPDEDGAALVTGDENSVSAGALVQAINETEAGSTALFLDSLFPTAWAQGSLPAVCSLPFHACAYAEADGTFEIEISASEGDDISVEEIDPTSGTATTERIRRPVPQNFLRFARPVVDTAVLPAANKLYALMGNNLENPDNGLVAIVDLGTEGRTRVPFDGADPARLVIHTGSRQGAVADTRGRFVAIVNLDLDNFDTPTKTETIPVPRDIVFNTAGSSLLVSSGPAARRSLTRIAIGATAAEVTGTVNQRDIPGIDSHDATMALDLINYQTATGAVQLVAFVSAVTIAGTPTSVIGLLDFDTLQFLSDLTPLPQGTQPNDVAFFQTADRLLVTDELTDQMLVYSFTVDPLANPQATLTLEGTITENSAGVIANPRAIAIDPVNRLAFVSAKNGTELRPDTVMTIDLQTEAVVDINPAGHNPTGIAWDPDDQILYVSARRSNSIVFWGLPDLLP